MSSTRPNATKIMVIRHAEKPTDSSSLYGVLSTGRTDTESLTVQGWVRAGALACLLAPPNGVVQNSDLAKPQFLFASGARKHSKSLRPQQTITPLSQNLGLLINTSYTKGEETDLVKEALTCDGVVLICWQHEYIPTIARLLLDSLEVPQQWARDRFDLVWLFNLNNIFGTYNFKQVPQNLLYGDQDLPI